MRSTSSGGKMAVLLLLVSSLAFSQASRQRSILTVKGFSGNAPVVQVNGKAYVEVESLARITNSSISFQASQIIFTFGSGPAAPAPIDADPLTSAPKGLSKDVLKAGIEEITVIEEWRTALANAVRNSAPVAPEWTDVYRRNADAKLALAATTVATEADRSFIALLRTEFANMQALSDKFVAMRKSLSYISPDSLDNDQLNQKVQTCARGLTSQSAGSPFQDVVVCH